MPESHNSPFRFIVNLVTMKATGMRLDCYTQCFKHVFVP